MKTMNEIINSINDENLKKFATGLQNKLETAKDAILEKMKKGNKVTGAEKSALKTSTSAYVEKNRGNVPQKVAAGLATALLVTMLASCDGGLVGELFPSNGDHETAESGIADGEQIPGFDEDANIIKYDKLEVDDQILKEPMSPIEYGLHFMEVFDYKDIMTSDSNSGNFLSTYNNIMKEQENYKWDIDAAICMALTKISHPNMIRDNVLITIRNEWAGWKHKIISTNYNFALESTDYEGKVYLTGFVNGRLENDLGLIDKDTIKIMKEVAKNYSYNDIVNNIRLKFFEEMYRLDQESERFYLMHNSIGVKDEEGNRLHGSKSHHSINYVQIVNEDSTQSFRLNFDYNVQEDYFDKLLASGKVVGYIPETEQPTWGTAGGNQDNDPNATGEETDEIIEEYPTFGTAGNPYDEPEEEITIG